MSESPSNRTPRDFVPIKGELQMKLVSYRKIILFWEVSEIPTKVIQLFFNLKVDELIQVVRIYDVTEINFNGKNAHHFHETTVLYHNGHWFIKGLESNRCYVAELGVKSSTTDFFPILRSNTLQTPLMKISNANEMNHELLRFQQIEDRPPKWIDHVSTYSYYMEPKKMEEKNE
ncbi:DUF4912 domain-containing protein [Neobacillus pocheonensis]|uniref:DUF4912 domain-containing protein n=1 Tax=Neobacillus pocheonensis TaxID=363869 RepID=A0ABT0W5M4_9BACI|nr:DUF4912 domain-containing protein [Neobacillus pocheonensis]